MSLISSLIPSLGTIPTTKPQAGSPTAAGIGPDCTNDLGPTVVPRYDVTEAAESFGLTVELPGVAKDGLELSIDHEQVRLVGRRAWRKPEAWSALHREMHEAAYELVLEHGRAIDVENVRAELRDGVLRVSLPKAGALKSRKIEVS